MRNAECGMRRTLRICMLVALVADPARSLHAQGAEGLPPVVPPGSPFSRYTPSGPMELPQRMPARLAMFADPNVQQSTPQNEPEAQPPVVPQLPPGAKPGVLQRVKFINTWLSGRDGDDIEFFDTELMVSLGFPFPTVESPLVVTPGFGAHFLDGPDGPDLPAQVYDLYVDFLWKKPLTPELSIDVAITPGWYSDFEQSNSDALRIGGRVIGFYTLSPVTKFVLGLVYLDRDDVNFLPVGGVVWTPNEDWRLELVAPKPRIAYRSGCDGEFSCWWYVAGEFGGGSWAIERASGIEDVANYSDWRIVLGQEWKRGLDSIFWAEIGYVFNRELSYNSGATPDFEPASTVMLRLGLGY